MAFTAPLVMGILDVTADSFADGGRHLGYETALARGLALHAEGADVIDVGGESAHPNAVRVSADIEQARVVPVVRELVRCGVRVGIDTVRASTAELAVSAGATFVNDVSSGKLDRRMFDVVADAGVDLILNHWRGSGKGDKPRNAACVTRFDDRVSDVCSDLLRSAEGATAAGVKPSAIILDPGLGFGKTSQDNWRLLNAIPSYAVHGHRVLIGASRKRFIGEAIDRSGVVRSVVERDTASAMAAALAAESGVWGVRVHNVVATKDALAVVGAWKHPVRKTLWD